MSNGYVTSKPGRNVLSDLVGEGLDQRELGLKGVAQAQGDSVQESRGKKSLVQEGRIQTDLAQEEGTPMYIGESLIVHLINLDKVRELDGSISPRTNTMLRT